MLRNFASSMVMIFLLLGSTRCTSDRDAILVMDGQSQYVIRLTKASGEYEQRAAHLLQSTIRSMTGVTLPIETAKAASRETVIWIVSAGRENGFPFDMDFNGLEQDGFRLERRGKAFVIAGGTDRGAYIGTARLLEHWDCRMYAPDVLYIPKKESLHLDAVTREEVPAFTYRETLMPNAMDRDYADWYGLHNSEDRARLWGLYVHTFDDLVPPKLYFESHPEYFTSLNGLRVPDAQICLSNEKVFDLVVDGLKKRMAERPEAIYWSVSQNDTFSPCGCEGCKSLETKYGGPSGALLHFVNRVARLFPDKILSTLAYQYTRDAPRNIVPESNVNIMLCTIECDRSIPLIEEKGEDAFKSDLVDWTRLTSNIYLWDYVVQFRSYCAPFPNLHVLQPNIRFFRDHGVKMMFQQGSGGSISEFHDLRTFLIAKLLWNPDGDVDALKDDFLKGYYGPAAPHVMKYIDACHNARAHSGGTLGIYGTPWDGFGTFLTPELLMKYEGFFKAAKAAVADQPVFLNRVRFAGLPTEYAILENGKKAGAGKWSWFRRAQDGISVNEEMLKRLRRFVDEAGAQQIKRLHERGLSPQAYETATMRYIQRGTEEHMALDKAVILMAPASEKYPAGGAAGLTDGFRGPEDYHCNWVGFEGKPFGATVDLDKVQPVKRVSLDFLQDESAWVFLPEAVEVDLSEEGSMWKKVGVVHRKVQERRVGSLIEHFDCRFESTPARYVRVKARHSLVCPDWHKGAGGKAWIFCDEIVVR